MGRLKKLKPLQRLARRQELIPRLSCQLGGWICLPPMETSVPLPRPRHTRATWEFLHLLPHLIGALPLPPRRRRLRRKWFWSLCTERRRRRRRKVPPRHWRSLSLATYLMPDLSHLDGIFTFFLLDAFHHQTFSKCLKSLETRNTVLLLYTPKSFDRPYSA